MGVVSGARDGVAPELNPGWVHRRKNTHPEARHALILENHSALLIYPLPLLLFIVGIKMADGAYEFVASQANIGEALGNGQADDLVHIEAALCCVAQGAVEPSEVAVHLDKGLIVGGEWAVTGHNEGPR